MLLVLALLSAFCAQLNFRRAPDERFWWQLTVITTEFGHFVVAVPLGVAAGAWGTETGQVFWLTLALCTVAVLGFLRPAFLAWRLGRKLPARLTVAFAASAVTLKPFSWWRLFFHPLRRHDAVRTEVFASHGGQDLALDFYAASGRRPAPCLVVIHGGGWDSGDRAQLAEWNHRWAARGYAVASVSYRLAPCWNWPAPQQDVLAALAWLQAREVELGLDPAGYVLVGRSAGGQIATAVGYGTEARGIAGVIAFYAPHDMPFAWSISSEEDTLNSVQLMRNYLGGPPDTPERQALYLAASGHQKVRPGVPPTLLLHGFPDTLVWYRHSRRLEAELARAAVPHLLLELPWATHGFDYNPDGPGGQLADYAIESFLRSLAARPAPAQV